MTRSSPACWTTHPAFVFVIVTLAVVAACGRREPARARDRIFRDFDEATQSYIRRCLHEADVEGKVTGIEDRGASWMVDVIATGPEGSRKHPPMAPDPYLIDKRTGKVRRL